MGTGSAAILGTWRDQLWSNYVRLESRSDSSEFYGSVAQIVPGSPRFTLVNSTAQITERTPALVRTDRSEYLLLSFMRVGRWYLEQDDRRTELLPGQFAIYDSTRPYRLHADGPFEQMVFRMPRALMECRMPRLSHMTARAYDSGSGPGALVAGFVNLLAGHAQSLSPDAVESFEIAGADLIATALALLGEGSDARSAPLFERIVAKLSNQVLDEGFDFAVYARQQGMSLRTLQRLFHENGTTPRAWLLQRRLDNIASQLRSPAFAQRSITEIALSSGFNDLTYFNRMFRARFSATPSQWRRNTGYAKS